MARLVQFEVPDDPDLFSFPLILNRRLQQLLDKQDEGNALTEHEAVEAEALVDLSEMLSLLRLKIARAEEI